MSSYSFDKFETGLEELGIVLTQEQFEQFGLYYDLLIEWNSFMNLTSITDWDEVIVKHFLDSLSIVKAVSNMTQVSYSLIDVGTGAGFPGIPIKIAFPNTKVVLLDSLNKRINFLNEVIDKLGLRSIETYHGRAEDFGHNEKFRESFDICVSRAVANLSVLSEICIPFVKEGGIFVSYKSEKSGEECELADNAIKVLSGKLKDNINFNLPLSDLNRNLLVIEKIGSTSKKYPRKAGVPSKNPL